MAGRWGFAKAGTLGWWWKFAEAGTIVTRRSVGHFATLQACVLDARKHGYVPETTAATSLIEPPEPAEPIESGGSTFVGTAPADAVVIRAVDAIAIYTGAAGDIIIRQRHAQRAIDCVITIPAQDAHRIIEALQRQLTGSAEAAAPLALAG